MPVKTLCIAGGRLQGIEAAYLARKAGYKTVLVDRRAKPPASTLVDNFKRLDVAKDKGRLKKAVEESDAVLPALEDEEALRVLEETCCQAGVPYLQDNSAFAVTSNKIQSQSFFRKMGLPTPEIWPRCRLPVIVKPAHASGSTSIYKVERIEELSQAVDAVLKTDREYLIQEYVEGPSLSLEVLSWNGEGQPLQVTGLEFDRTFGCKRVVAPCRLDSFLEEEIFEMGRRMAEGLNLSGLTDVQLILGPQGIRVIEMNARLPSQTPTVVYHSTGVNMVELLCSLFTQGNLRPVKIPDQKAVIYQHVKIEGKQLTVTGEHSLSDAEGLRFEKNFMGADEAVTNLNPEGEAEGCVATLITVSRRLRDAKKKMEKSVNSLRHRYGLTGFSDPSPEGLRQKFYDEIDS
ncbi:3-methylornithine--L-lysine ligase PylC [Candidatus Hecatella orcuttiae]|jgi:pyrrolysine biosynthesis protein PylC|uniref:3-methylornithine--L-lysine ligase PylC n=1 Tax=Candidatus Hecatella orcuttiae TaxID=1935119 RepID=UPI002867F604|nr:3-methylornithine--L-lysine ligase PylC [Candidatus Hecatella orcuttiae]